MRTLVVGAAIVDLMMKVERLPKSGEDIPCKETKTVVGGCAYNVANTLRNLKCEHDLCVPKEHLSQCRERNATSKRNGLSKSTWTTMRISTSQAIRFVEKVGKSFHNG